MYAVIMAGGQGTRLWPKSRKNQPKQLQALVSQDSLIRETFDRLLLVTSKDKIIVSTTPEYADEIKTHLPDLLPDNLIIEPYPMGTAAACALVSKIISLKDPEAIVSFFPSDHHIKSPDKFAATLKFAEKVCRKHPGHILTIGLKPTKADTGLGYIEMGSQIDAEADLTAKEVARFVEKPDQKTADKYLASGKYLWNAGMFVWTTKHIISLFAKHLPGTTKVLDAIAKDYGTTDYDPTLKNLYKEVDNISIDYGIMEKEKAIIVIPADFGWSDIGNWGTLLDVVCEVHGTNLVCRGDHIGVDNTNVLIMGHNKLIATVGLEDIIVVDTPDVLLVCNGKKDQKIKELINELKDKNRTEYL